MNLAQLYDGVRHLFPPSPAPSIICTKAFLAHCLWHAGFHFTSRFDKFAYNTSRTRHPATHPLNGRWSPLAMWGPNKLSRICSVCFMEQEEPAVWRLHSGQKSKVFFFTLNEALNFMKYIWRSIGSHLHILYNLSYARRYLTSIVKHL